MERKLAVFSDIQDPIVYTNLRSMCDAINDLSKKVELIEELLSKHTFYMGDLKNEVALCKEKLGLSGLKKEK